jgi:hypothetical protein
MTFLTPLAALAALAALVPLGATILGRIRVRAVRRTLLLQPPPPGHGAGRASLAVAAVVLLGLAAAQPALTEQSRPKERAGVAVLFVLDISRSMAAAAGPTAPTRLDRATNAAVRLRDAIPSVPAGLATLTDRVLPDLLPVPDVAGFDAVARRTVAIEEPAPLATSIRATTYGVLGEIASGDYFEPHITRRVVVLLTDGESNPFDPASVASALPAKLGYRFLAIRFWNADESVYDSDGHAEAGYEPDPEGRVLLATLAAAAGGRAFEEDDLGSAASYLHSVLGSGRSVVPGATVSGRRALAPYIAGLALLLLLASMLPWPLRWRRSSPFS